MVIRRARRILSLSSSERRMLTRAMIQLALVDLALRVHPLRRLIDPHDGHATQRPVTPDALNRAHVYAYWIALASRHFPLRAQCLHRSLVLHRWLRSQGLPSVLRIGVCKDGNQLRAHAWVELGSEILNDETGVVHRFAVLGPRGAAAPAGVQRASYDTTLSLDPPSSMFLRNEASAYR